MRHMCHGRPLLHTRHMRFDRPHHHSHLPLYKAHFTSHVDASMLKVSVCQLLCPICETACKHATISWWLSWRLTSRLQFCRMWLHQHPTGSKPLLAQSHLLHPHQSPTLPQPPPLPHNPLALTAPWTVRQAMRAHFLLTAPRQAFLIRCIQTGGGALLLQMPLRHPPVPFRATAPRLAGHR